MALDCIESILNNSYSEYEILVIDQGPQRTLESEIIARYGSTSKIRYFFLEPPGVSRACSLGVHYACSEIVAFIDDDAIADPNWLSSIAQTFTEIVPRPGLMGGRILPLWPSPKPRWYPAEREFLLGMYDIGDKAQPFPEGDLPMSGNMAGLRQIIIEMGAFDENLGADYSRPHMMLAGEDSMLSQRIKDAGHLLYYQPAAVVHHRILELKLSPRFFLRRHFWEGVTVVTRMKLMGISKANASSSVLAYYTRAIARSMRRPVFPVKRTESKRPLSASAMSALARISYILGIVYGAARSTHKGTRGE